MAANRSMESRVGRTKQRKFANPLVHRIIRQNVTFSISLSLPLSLHTGALVLTLLSTPGYGENGERLVAGVVPLNSDKSRVLLIQSTKRSSWVLPKGGWESDESCSEAAQREAWEEAGIICTISRDLGQITETRTAKQISKDAPKALYQFYEVTVTKEESEWPEREKRNRKWSTFAEAEEALQARPELLEALKRCTMQR